MRKLFYLLIFSVFIFSSCNKAAQAIINSQPSSGNSLTVNGDIFKNQTFNINVIAKSADSFNNTLGGTLIGVSGLASDSESVTTTIVFNGKLAAGTFSLSNQLPNIYIAITPLNTSGPRTYISNSGTLTVTNFGAVGTNITGTFSGNFAPAPGSIATTGITVTNGTFSVKRTN